MKGEIYETKMHSEFPSRRPIDTELQDHDQDSEEYKDETS